MKQTKKTVILQWRKVIYWPEACAAGKKESVREQGIGVATVVAFLSVSGREE